MRPIPMFALLCLSLTACGAAPTAAGAASDATATAEPAAATRSPAIVDDAAAEPAASAASAAEGEVVVGPASVWQGDLSACRAGGVAVDACLISTMRDAGATPQALAAATRLVALGDPGHVEAWHEDDGIGHASILYPFRANTNQGLWLVDATGRAIDVDHNVLPAGAVRLRASLQPFLAAHPDALPFAPAQPVGSEPLADGGVRLRFDVPMRTCHACATVGTLELGYDFDRERRFQGRSVIALRDAD